MTVLIKKSISSDLKYLLKEKKYPSKEILINLSADVYLKGHPETNICFIWETFL